MDNQEFYQLAQSKAEKFNYALLSLTFAILALSFQFSPKMRKLWPWVLIGAWVCFFLSALFGGLRLTREVLHMRLNYVCHRLETFIQERIRNLQDRQFLATIAAGNILDNMTGRALTLQGVKDSLIEETKNLKTANKNMENAAKWSPLFFQFQFFGLLTGVVLNGIFVAKNFLDG